MAFSNQARRIGCQDKPPIVGKAEVSSLRRCMKPMHFRSFVNLEKLQRLPWFNSGWRERELLYSRSRHLGLFSNHAPVGLSVQTPIGTPIEEELPISLTVGIPGPELALRMDYS